MHQWSREGFFVSKSTEQAFIEFVLYYHLYLSMMLQSSTTICNYAIALDSTSLLIVVNILWILLSSQGHSFKKMVKGKIITNSVNLCMFL